MKPQTTPESMSPAGMEEVLHLYGGWLAYLLTRIGEDTIRVPCRDIRQALKTLSCRVSREGDEYVIRQLCPGETRSDTDGSA